MINDIKKIIEFADNNKLNYLMNNIPNSAHFTFEFIN